MFGRRCRRTRYRTQTGISCLRRTTGRRWPRLAGSTGTAAQPGPLKPPLHRPENSGRAASPAERAQGHPLWPALAPSLTKEVETTLDSPLASLTYERFGRNAVGWRLNGDRKGQARTASTIRARGPREAAAAAAAAPTPVGLDLVEQWAASSAAAAASATVAAAVAAPAGGKIEQPPSVAKGKLGKAVALLGTGKQINTGGGGSGGGGGLVIKSSHRAALRGGSGGEPDLISDLGAKLGALRRQCSSWEQYKDLERRMYTDPAPANSQSLLAAFPADSVIS